MALLDYIYGGQPEVNLEAGLELLRLAEAYDLPKLAGAIEAGFRASLDSSAALKILQVAQGLHDLKAACEEKVAQEFETCSQHPDFGKLRSVQLARILKREDLVRVSGRGSFKMHLSIGSRSPRREMVHLVCFCNLWISIQFPLKICFVLAVCLSLVSMVMICTEEATEALRVPCNGREAESPQRFSSEEALFAALVTRFGCQH